MPKHFPHLSAWTARIRSRHFIPVTVMACVLLTVTGWAGWFVAKLQYQTDLAGRSGQIGALEASLASEVVAHRLTQQQLVVERATREVLASELAQVQAEAVSRQESLAFLDSLLTSNDRSRAVRLLACELQTVDVRRFRYRALVAQGFNSDAEFAGKLLVTVEYVRRGQRGRVVLGEDKPLPVRVKHYERAEGELVLPADAVPQQLDIRILPENGRQALAQCRRKIGGS